MRECRLRAEARADATPFRPLDRPVQLQRPTPERLVAKRVEAKNLPPLLDKLLGVFGRGIGPCIVAAPPMSVVWLSAPHTVNAVPVSAPTRTPILKRLRLSMTVLPRLPL